MTTRPLRYDTSLVGYRRHRTRSLLNKPIHAGTWSGLAIAVGACYGVTVNDNMAEYVLWNHTGFPSFWNKKPVQECRQQLAEFFKDVIKRGWEAAADADDD